MSRRIQRGSEVGRIKLVYEAHKKELPQWLRFEPLPIERRLSLGAGLGGYLDFGIGDRNIRFTPIFAIANADDLGRGVLRRRLALRNEEAGHSPARRQLRMVMVRSGLAEPHAGRAAAQPRDPPAVRHANDDHATAEVRVHSGPQRRGAA